MYIFFGQLIASCLGQYSNGMGSAMVAGIGLVRIAPGFENNTGIGMVTSTPMTFGSKYGQGLGYERGFGHTLDHRGGYGHTLDYRGGYGHPLDYRSGYGHRLGHSGGYDQTLSYAGGIAMVTSKPMRFGSEYGQGLGYGRGFRHALDCRSGYGRRLGYGGSYDQTLGYGGGYGPAPSYGSRRDQRLGCGGGYNPVLGYGSSNGVASVTPTGLGGGHGPMGLGLSYGGATGHVNGAAFAGYGRDMAAYPYTPMIAMPTIMTAQKQASFTSNENTNTNINIDNRFRKHRRGHLIRDLLGIPRL